MVRTQGGKKDESSKTVRLVSTNWRMPISVASFCNIIYLSALSYYKRKHQVLKRAHIQRAKNEM